MDSLPTELLQNIFRLLAEDSRHDKNVLLKPRFVCKAFDAVIRPYVLKTVQLDFVKFADPRKHPPLWALDEAGQLCHAIYCDVSIIRDEEEMERWKRLFGYAAKDDPEILKVLDDFGQFCMSSEGFSEGIFANLLANVLLRTPHATNLRLNLPIQMLGRTSPAATILLATVLACLVHRPSEYSRLEVLALEGVSERSILSICRNPIDLENARQVFQALKALVICMQRNHARDSVSRCGKDFWQLLSHAQNLETLSIFGWRTRRIVNPRRTAVWSHERMNSLLFDDLVPSFCLDRLRCLELKHIETGAPRLLSLIERHKSSLRELYLVDVLLKVVYSEVDSNEVLWIGHSASTSKEQGAIWVADELLAMKGLNLRVLRVSGLGYDEFDMNELPSSRQFDLVDPSGRNMCFDHRFVAKVLGLLQPQEQAEKVDGSEAPDLLRTTPYRPVPWNRNSIWESRNGVQSYPCPSNSCSYDVNDYRSTHQNTTSEWLHSIDGLFHNHSRGAEQKLRALVEVTERCYDIVSADITRMQALNRLPSETAQS